MENLNAKRKNEMKLPSIGITLQKNVQILLYIYVSIVTKYRNQDKLWKEGLMVPEGSALPSQWGNMAAGRHGGRNS